MDSAMDRLFGKSTTGYFTSKEEARIRGVEDANVKAISELEGKINEYELQIEVLTVDAKKLRSSALLARKQKKNDSVVKDILRKELMKKTTIQRITASQTRLMQQLDSLQQLQLIAEEQRITKNTTDHINRNVKPLINVDDAQAVMDEFGDIQADVNELNELMASMDTSDFTGEEGLTNELSLLDNEITEDLMDKLEDSPVIHTTAKVLHNEEKIELNHQSRKSPILTTDSISTSSNTNNNSLFSSNSATSSPITTTRNEVKKRIPRSLIDDF